MSTPWDIYADERKLPEDWTLGFLTVPNSPSFMHKLHRCRYVRDASGGSVYRDHEVHWHAPRMDTLPIAEQWLYRVYQHRGVRFFRVPWQKHRTKESVIIDFVERFCLRRRLVPPFDVVLFLDFDSSHKRGNLQNHIRSIANISRCYHLDSKNNDILQCCDLLLGATATLAADPTIRLNFDPLRRRRREGVSLKDSEVKRYLAGLLATYIDRGGRSVIDLADG